MVDFFISCDGKSLVNPNCTSGGKLLLLKKTECQSLFQDVYKKNINKISL